MSLIPGPIKQQQHEASADGTCARYKYQRLRDRLRQAVISGELAGKLPGERELARRYEANAKTINKALCDLTTEGLLVRHVGRGTFVAEGAGVPGSSRRKLLTYAWVAALGSEEVVDVSIHRQVEALIRERGHRLISVVTPGLSTGEVCDSALTPGQLRSWDGLVIAGRATDSFLADLHRRHLPSVMIQSTHERIRTSVVLPDYSQGAFELAQQLVRLGHRRIALLMTPESMPAACAAEQGYRAALLRNKIEPGAALVAVDCFDWAGLLRETERPTALICVGAGLAAQAWSEAMEVGLRLPTELSIAALPEPGRFLGQQALTAYEVQSEVVARWVVELLLTATPGQLPRTIIVPGHLIDRGSAAPPPGGAAEVARNPAHAEI